MRKIIIGILIIVCLFIFITNLNQQKEIRVRIIPSSDLKEDIKTKEKAKDITICYLKEAYDKDYQTYLDNMNKTIKDFEIVLTKQLKQNVLVTLSNHTLYNKTYNNSAVENKNVMTLYVVIGEGKGSNWWGTVYPDFLEVNSSEEWKYESLILSIFNKIKGE